MCLGTAQRKRGRYLPPSLHGLPVLLIECVDQEGTLGVVGRPLGLLVRDGGHHGGHTAYSRGLSPRRTPDGPLHRGRGPVGFQKSGATNFPAQLLWNLQSYCTTRSEIR